MAALNETFLAELCGQHPEDMGSPEAGNGDFANPKN